MGGALKGNQKETRDYGRIGVLLEMGFKGKPGKPKAIFGGVHRCPFDERETTRKPEVHFWGSEEGALLMKSRFEGKPTGRPLPFMWGCAHVCWVLWKIRDGGK